MSREIIDRRGENPGTDYDWLTKMAIVAAHKAGGVYTFTRAEYNEAIEALGAKNGDEMHLNLKGDGKAMHISVVRAEKPRSRSLGERTH